MTDDEILEHLGLEPDEIRDLFRKLNDFFESLNRKQKRAFLGSLRSAHDAAAELDRGQKIQKLLDLPSAGAQEPVTPHRLETFLRTFAPPNGITCDWCDEGRHH